MNQNTTARITFMLSWMCAARLLSALILPVADLFEFYGGSACGTRTEITLACDSQLLRREFACAQVCTMVTMQSPPILAVQAPARAAENSEIK
jgi:hypothetical protein